MRKLALENVWWVTFLIALILLLCNTFSWGNVKVDITSLVLLAILLISPFASSLKKIKFGDFEAEINHQEVQKVKEEIEAQLPDSDEQKVQAPELLQAIDNIKTLVSTDHVIALAKLRIELEKIITRLFKMVGGQEQGDKQYSLVAMVRQLTLREVLPNDMSAPLQQVIFLCNRAVHGDDIRKQDADTVVDLGISLLKFFGSFIQDFIIKPQETMQVSGEEVTRFEKAKYRVTTIIPYSENPVRNIRYLNQEGLDEFLEGYGEHGEFVVEIKSVE